MRLTLPQQDIYFDQLLYPNEPIYNIGAKIEIKGDLNIAVFEKAYTKLIEQHDAYRSILSTEKGNVSFQLVENFIAELGFVDFSSSENPVEDATLYMQIRFSEPFDLFNNKNLYRFTLVKVGNDFHYLFSVYHHIITDGWGTSLMFKRLVQNYNELLEFNSIISDYPFSYKDFINEDKEYEVSESFASDKMYWANKFYSLPENLFDKIDDSIQTRKSKRKELTIKREVYNQLNQLASNSKCSTFHLLLAVLYAYFGRKHENNDFAIGLPVLNRKTSRYKKTVGLFMGVSPLRISLDFDAPFQELIDLIKNQLRQDYRHQRFPLGKLIQELQIFKEQQKLFNITFSYEKQDYGANFKYTNTKVIPLSHQSERVALAIYVREFDEMEDVKIDFDYNLNYFDDLRITEIIHHFEKLITAVLMQPDAKLKDLVYLSESEKYKILEKFNDNKVEFSKDKTVIDLFREQVYSYSNKVALKDDFNSYTYFEADKLSNLIAQYIISVHGEADKSPVCVMLERSAEMILVLLGILKSGRSYIPLDPNFPKDRLSFIVNNSQSNLIICDQDYELGGIKYIDVSLLKDILQRQDEYKEFVFNTISPNGTAYILYTSGSTGRPKGVEIGHRSLVNFLSSIQQFPGVSSQDTLFSVTTISFDISILEFFAPLISGATLYIASGIVLSDVNLIIEKITKIQPTIIQGTPSFYQMLFNGDWKGNKMLKILCGGDLLSESLAEKLINHSLEVWNMYGPTETTIWSSIKKMRHPKDASIIGKPIHNTQFYILDKFLHPKSVGVPGAIYIAGDGLAKGYYKNSSLTAEKFIQNPFRSNARLYETGDMGKWNDAGEIFFLGRNDNQVKVRGYRIELGDIETQLNKLDGILDSVVIAKKDNDNESFLVAYVLYNERWESIEKIVSELKLLLPAYMIPYVIIPLENFPLTPNLKIDRKSLQQREIRRDTNHNYFRAPISNLEKKLLGYWKDVLQIKDPISVSSNFFILGGHSLKAVKLIGIIAKELSFNITLKTIFDYPTIELLAEYLEGLSPDQFSSIPSCKSKLLYELTPSQYNIWLASQQGNISVAYNMSAVYDVAGSINLNVVTKAINEIINKYEILRTNFFEVDGVPYQKVNPFENVAFSVSLHEIRNKKIKDVIDELSNAEFDLEIDLLLKCYLLRSEENQLTLLFCTHHIIMDGISLEIFVKEFIENYNKNSILTDSDKKISKVQFKDYSEWLNKTLKNNRIRNELFWTNYLDNYKTKKLFHYDFDNKENQQRAYKYDFEIVPHDILALKKMAVEENVSFYSILVTVLNVLIYKLSGYNDICIGLVNSGRDTAEINDEIGMFAKTLVFRSKFKIDPTFKEVLREAHNNLIELNDYQNVPHNVVVKPILDVMLVYQNPEFSFHDINGFNDMKLAGHTNVQKYSRIPIVFNFYEYKSGVRGIIEYNCDLFEMQTIESIAQRYIKIIAEVMINPAILIDSIDMKLGFEKNTSFDFDFNF